MKIPKARKLPSGSWFIQLRIGGESISITRPTEGQAIAEALAIKEGIKDAPKKKEASKHAVTLTQAIDRYIESRNNTISPSTIRGYRVIQAHRLREIMDEPVEALTEKALQMACNLDATRCSAKTLYNAWGLVSAAIKNETGKTFNVRLPQKIRNERNFLDSEQIPVFLDAIKGDPAEVAALLALHSLRRSEMLALTWDDIDLDFGEMGMIQVRGSVVPDETNMMVRKKTNKNSASRRNIPIMIPRLHALFSSREEESGSIITYNPYTIFRHINAACQKAGLPEVGIHGLRHSFASLAYAIGLSEKDTMDLGGWSDDGTMRRIYTHISDRDRTKKQNLMAEYYNSIANKNANDIGNSL